MKKLANIVFLGLSLMMVSCSHMGHHDSKSCCGEKKQCKTDKSCCKSGQCEVKKKKS